MDLLKELFEASKRTPEVISAIKNSIDRDAIKMMNDKKKLDAVLKAINSHFADQAWSLEKDEWNRMTSPEKKALAAVAIKKLKL